MTDDTQIVDKPEPIVPMLREDFFRVIILGAVAGLLMWVLSVVLHRYVFDAYLCQNDISSQCGNAKNYAAGVASLLVAIPVLGALVRMRVYRPLLVLLASMISVWGVIQISLGLEWFMGLLLAFIMYGLSFGTFAWLARIRHFWISLAAIIVVVAVTRFILTI